MERFFVKIGISLNMKLKSYLIKGNVFHLLNILILRSDENKIINEFSFDIDSAYIKKNHFFKLMIENIGIIQINWLFYLETFIIQMDLVKPNILHLRLFY